MTREELPNEATREDKMREALKHYEELATKACWHRSDIPEAIRAYYAPLPPAEGAEEYIKRKHPQDWDEIPQWHIDELNEFATIHAQRLAEKMVEDQLPSNKEIHEAALAWAKEHSEAPDKDCPDWLIRDYEAGAYFVRQCMGCWNKTDKMHDKRLLRFIKWLRYRNFTDDTMTDDGWLNLYRNNPDIPE